MKNQGDSGQDYSKIVTARITPSEAADKIGSIANWWTKNVKGATHRLGDTFTVDFGQTFVDFKIVELVPGKRIVWLVTNCNLHWIQDKTEWNGTRVVWDISTDQGTTAVRMTHVGLVPGVECYENCERGWNFHIGESLQGLLRNNTGLPA